VEAAPLRKNYGRMTIAFSHFFQKITGLLLLIVGSLMLIHWLVYTTIGISTVLIISSLVLMGGISSFVNPQNQRTLVIVGSIFGLIPIAWSFLPLLSLISLALTLQHTNLKSSLLSIRRIQRA
jgi:hypothetical protein